MTTPPQNQTHFKTVEEAQEAMVSFQNDEYDFDDIGELKSLLSNIWHSAYQAGVEKCIEAVPEKFPNDPQETANRPWNSGSYRMGYEDFRREMLRELEALRK